MTADGSRLDDAALPAWLHDLGVPGIVDVHVHFMPAEVQRKVWDVFDRAEEVYGTAWPIRYRGTDAERALVLAALGVRAYTALSYAHRPGMAEWLTRWSLDFAARTPDCLGSGTFFPERGAAAYVERALAAGVAVFKIHLQVGGFDPRHRLLEPVWDQLERSGTPTVVHCGSAPLAGPFTGPRPIEEVLRRHPELRVVVAHGGMPEWHAFCDLAERYPGVSLDTTMVATDFMRLGWEMPADVVTRWGEMSDRILFGSDFPNIPYQYAHQVEALERLGLGRTWLRAVLWENPVRVLGLGT